MSEKKTKLQQRIDSGGPILLAEVSPAPSNDPAAIREVVRQYAGKVDALGISDNRDRARMSAVAAASLAIAEGVEPILHVVTRDRNRIALVSDCLGAQALGIRNLLCTSGTHQTLGSFYTAKNVFDVDAVQLLQIYANLGPDGSLVGEQVASGSSPLVLGGVAAPFADPMELQVMRLAKKVTAGAKFLITQPVFDLERFDVWWKSVTERELQQKVAIVAGIEVLTDADEAQAYAQKRPDPMIPDIVLARLASETDKKAQRAAGIEVAVATIQQLSAVEGLRGFEISSGNGDHDAVLEVIDTCGLCCGQEAE